VKGGGFLSIIKGFIVIFTHIVHGVFFGLFIGLIFGAFISSSTYLNFGIILIGLISNLYTRMISWESLGQSPKARTVSAIVASVFAGLGYGVFVGALSEDLVTLVVLAGIGSGCGSILSEVIIYLARRFISGKHSYLPELLIPLVIVGPIIILLGVLYVLVLFAILIGWIFNEMIF